MKIIWQAFERKREDYPDAAAFEPVDAEQAALAARAFWESQPRKTNYADLQKDLFKTGRLSWKRMERRIAEGITAITWASHVHETQDRDEFIKCFVRRMDFRFRYLFTPVIHAMIPTPIRNDLMDLAGKLFSTLTQIMVDTSIPFQLTMLAIVNDIPHIPVHNTQKLELLARGSGLISHTSEQQLIEHWQAFVDCCVAPPSARFNWNELINDRACRFSEIHLVKNALSILRLRWIALNELERADEICKKLHELQSRHPR